jgi:hypothetical protein
MRKPLPVLLLALVATAASAAPKEDFAGLHPALRVTGNQLRAWVTDGIRAADEKRDMGHMVRRFMRPVTWVGGEPEGVTAHAWCYDWDGSRVIMAAYDGAVRDGQRGPKWQPYPDVLHVASLEVRFFLSGSKAARPASLRVKRAELRDDRGRRWSFPVKKATRAGHVYIGTAELLDANGKARITPAAKSISLHAFTADGREFFRVYPLRRGP